MCGTGAAPTIDARWAHIRMEHKLDLCGSCLRVLPREEIGAHIAKCLQLDLGTLTSAFVPLPV